MSDTASPAGGNEVTRQYLLDLLREMDEHITALQAVGHRRMAETAGAPIAVEIKIRVGPENGRSGGAEFDEPLGVPVCVTTHVICGESETGYIICDVSYCEITGPITVLPD